MAYRWLLYSYIWLVFFVDRYGFGRLQSVISRLRLRGHYNALLPSVLVEDSLRPFNYRFVGVARILLHLNVLISEFNQRHSCFPVYPLKLLLLGVNRVYRPRL